MQIWKKCRTGLAFTLLLGVLAASYIAQQKRLEQEAAKIDLPVVRVTQNTSEVFATASGAGTALEQYKKEREAARAKDINTLKALTENSNLSSENIASAASQLQELIRCRENETALEGALMAGGFSPCLAVVQKGAVTVLTQKDSLTQGEASLILTMAASHTGESTANIKIITGDML